MTTFHRIVILLVLIAVYFLCCGDFTVAPTIYLRLFTMYVVGAGMALFSKGDQIGTLQPISTRPVLIIVGLLLMGAGFVWTLAIKGHL